MSGSRSMPYLEGEPLRGRHGDVEDIDAGELMFTCDSNPAQRLLELVPAPNEFCLDTAVLDISDPAGDAGGATVVLNVGAKADTLDDAAEADPDGVAVS